MLKFPGSHGRCWCSKARSWCSAETQGEKGEVSQSHVLLRASRQPRSSLVPQALPLCFSVLLFVPGGPCLSSIPWGPLGSSWDVPAPTRAASGSFTCSLCPELFFCLFVLAFLRSTSLLSAADLQHAKQGSGVSYVFHQLCGLKTLPPDCNFPLSCCHFVFLFVFLS